MNIVIGEYGEYDLENFSKFLIGKTIKSINGNTIEFECVEGFINTLKFEIALTKYGEQIEYIFQKLI